jgi:NurA-like 5'-3' nuclease
VELSLRFLEKTFRKIGIKKLQGLAKLMMPMIDEILKEIERPVDASDVREEIKKIIDLYIEADMLRKLAYAKLLNLANEMIERLKGIEDPEAEKLIRRIERDKSLRTVIAILDRYERLMRKQNLY